MDARFFPHNSHLEDQRHFRQRDPQLRMLAKQVYVHKPALLASLPIDQPGIYTLGGGRQIGKTTLLKQWMADLLDQGCPPAALAFFTGELVDDHHSLVRLVANQLQAMPREGTKYILFDEITYVRHWEKGVKYLADAGLLEGTVLVITGSDLSLIRDARSTFPGRRGRAERVDFHLRPLSLREVVELKGHADLVEHCLSGRADSHAVDEVFRLFDEYLIHGGYLTAINDLAQEDTIAPATLATYADWLRGDMLKRGKQEHYLREVIGAVVARYGSQVTWNALARDLSIDHPSTVADYAAALVSFDALFIQPALLEHKLVAAPKKARKLLFTDPFIFHAARAWLADAQDPFMTQIKPALADKKTASRLAEACAVMHYQRRYPTFYIKAEGEVDIAIVEGQRFVPIEVKWCKQSRSADLKQIAKYTNGKILHQARSYGVVNGVPAEPLPLGLLAL